jgi:hypothetical protein
MKLIVFLYLEEDEPRVEQLLREHGIEAFSQMSLEGHGSGASGWYGAVAPYASRMTLTAVAAPVAAELLAALSRGVEASNARHPIHALQLPIEALADSGLPLDG